MADHSLINSTFPVLLPETPQLSVAKDEFEAYIKSLVYPSTSTTLPIQTAKQHHREDESNNVETDMATTISAPFMTALLSNKATVPTFDSTDNKMQTENADVAYRTTGEPLVDLFHELEDVISSDRLHQVLDAAWKNDADATLRIIWNARSIHLGKSSRPTFYRAMGWLAERHPLTLLVNLPWLVRPLIRKNVPKEGEKSVAGEEATMVDVKDADSDFEMIDEEGESEPERKKVKVEDDAEMGQFDIKYGLAHGYWKDLLNILALAANDELKVDGHVRPVLNPKPEKKKWKRDWTEGGKRKEVREERHERVVKKLEENGFYKALHLTVARLFADQLTIDLARLHSGNRAEMKKISLAGKWAPGNKGMHDEHTCIVSTIAEMMDQRHQHCPENVESRELYLKLARIQYQSQTLSPLRKHIDVVERKISDEKFADIKYDRVPSLAMYRYTPLFAKKDYDRFDEYIDKLADGKAQISGATLLPSTLVAAVLHGFHTPTNSKGTKAMVEKKIQDTQFRAVDGQWKTLVQRIRDSGTLADSIAVCDVSGSMTSPHFHDGTAPIHSAIGLSLLIAEVTKPPFGGAFITFSNTPQVLRVGGESDTRSLKEKVVYINGSTWSMNTDFVAVFEKLILPMALENQVKPEDMVKQIFVFSDMQFDSAASDSDRWTTSYERIREEFRRAGYEMPRLIFWNFAGGRAGFGQSVGDETAPKPVTAAEENTALVSGYSQGQLKMFLEGGGFDEEEEDSGEDEEAEVKEAKEPKEKKQQDPLAVVKKAISHEAYRMLKVVD